MTLLVIRHAIAEDKQRFRRTGADDTKRPLTAQGRQRMKIGARGLRKLVPKIDVLATSPLVRAVQTADIVASAYKGARKAEVPALSPDGSPQAVMKWLQKQKRESMVAVVGHEPDLGGLVTWLLTAERKPFVEMKKGGACLLEFEAMRPGRAKLAWMLTPGQLRDLAK